MPSALPQSLYVFWDLLSDGEERSSAVEEAVCLYLHVRRVSGQDVNTQHALGFAVR